MSREDRAVIEKGQRNLILKDETSSELRADDFAKQTV